MPGHHVPGSFECRGVKYPSKVLRELSLNLLDPWKVEPTDVVIANYPKSGMTWTMGLVKKIIKQEVDPDTPEIRGFPFLELRWLGSMPAAIENMDRYNHPRGFRTHLHYEYMAKKVEKEDLKVVVALRNPKDMLVSFYYMYKQNALGNYEGSFEEFFGMFERKELMFGDIFEWTKGWWVNRHLPNIMIVRFEDMKDDCLSVVQKLVKFLEKDIGPEEMKEIVAGSSFANMKTEGIFEGRPAGEEKPLEDKKFFRKGEVGDWKNHFTPEMNEKMEKLMKEHFEPIGLTFD